MDWRPIEVLLIANGITLGLGLYLDGEHGAGLGLLAIFGLMLAGVTAQML